MTFIESWKDGLHLVTPQGIKQLAFETWDALKRVAHVLYARWFIILACIFGVIGLATGELYSAAVVFLLLQVPIIFLAYLPIDQDKNFGYFCRSSGKYTWALFKLMVLACLLFLAIVTILLFVLVITMPLDNALNNLTGSSFGKQFFVTFWASAFTILLGTLAVAVGPTQLVLLFYFMKASTMRAAVKRSLRFALYNAPLLIIYAFVEWGLISTSEFLVGEKSIVYILCTLAITVISLVLYMKRINAQPELYA